MSNEVSTLARIVRLAGAKIVDIRIASQIAKSNEKDFVTNADVESQELIRDELKKSFPDAIIVSEEDAPEHLAQLNATTFTGFVIDPLDGTYSFKRGLRESTVSIGHISNGEPDYGVVYDPYRDELLWAVKGGGAFYNDAAIRVSGQANLSDASIAITNSYNGAAMARNMKRHLTIFEETGVMPWLNCHGSGVFTMMQIAQGRFDIYHHNGLKPWDNAAGFLIVREAGGVVHDLAGNDASFMSNTVLMGVPAIVSQLEAVFAKFPEPLNE